MDNSIFIPSREVTKEIRNGGGSPFWKGFWEEFSSPTEYNHRVSRLAAELTPITTQTSTSLPDDANLYAEVKYDNQASSKSSRPSDIWEESNLEVVQSTDDVTFTVSGKKSDFERLSTILNSASYGVAKGETNATTKQKNINREIYAVSSIRDKNKGLANRLDVSLEKLVELNVSGELDVIIELYPDRRLNEYDSIYRRLSGHLGEEAIKKRDDHALFSNLTYFGHLSIDEIKYLLENNDEFNFIRVIRVSPDYIVSRSFVNIDPSEWTLDQPSTDETVGVIDSGISSPVFNRLRFNTEKFVGRETGEDKEHGTFVCARALLADQVAEVIAGRKETLTPACKYLDVQVLFTNSSGELKCDDDQLLKAIDEVTQRYPDIRVYNLSISSTKQLDERFPSELTEKLDKIANERDILFICVTGNNKICGSVEYEDIFSTHKNSSFLMSPGDTVSNLTVGSCVEEGTIDDDAGAVIGGYPSPFTCKAIIRNKLRKPDLVSYGGNYLSLDGVNALPPGQSQDEVSENKYGVISLAPDHPQRGNGSSYSAPMVTHQAIKMLDAIKKSNLRQRINCDNNLANLVKSLLIHSTANSEVPAIDDAAIREALGFGVPNIDSLLGGTDDRVTILYCDKIDGVTKKHKLLFQLPDFVTAGNIKFTFSLAYNPPVDRNFSEYAMLDVTGSVRVPYLIQGNPKPKYQYITPSSDWRNYTTRGSGVQHFSMVKRSRLKNNVVEVLVQLLAFEEYERKFDGRMEEMQQPYAIALTLEDLTGSGSLKRTMIEMNQIESLVNVEVQV
jgi:hypothetical protein